MLQFQANGKTPATATEILQRLEFLHQLLGPAVARIQKELLQPLLERHFNLMLKSRALPTPPPILQGGAQIDIVFEGPLARAQRSDELRSLQDTLVLGQSLAAMSPDSLDNINTDEVFRDLFRITGTRQRYLRDPNEVGQIREGRLQQIQQQQQLEMAESIGRTAKDVSASNPVR